MNLYQINDMPTGAYPDEASWMLIRAWGTDEALTKAGDIYEHLRDAMPRDRGWPIVPTQDELREMFRVDLIHLPDVEPRKQVVHEERRYEVMRLAGWLAGRKR